MAVKIIAPATGVSIGDPLTADTLNQSIRDQFQRNVDSYKTIPSTLPLTWDITEPPAIILIDTPFQLNIPPGIVMVDQSQFSQGQKVILGFTGEVGPRLIVPINRDESVEAEIVIDCSGYMVNNTLATNLPVPNEFRIHPGGATLVGATADRLFCKDAWFFHLVLNELESNLPSLQQLSLAEQEFVQLQSDLNSILTLIDPLTDALIDSRISNLDDNRLDAMNWSLNNSGSSLGQGFNNSYQEASDDVLQDLSSIEPTVQIKITNDMMKYVLVVPVNANAEKINFELVPGDNHPDGNVFTNILLSVSINARKAIPFTVNLGTLNNHSINFTSDYEEMSLLINNTIPSARMLFL